jgi:GAF domain-containing protein
MEEIQRRAHQEELINQMVSRTQSTLNLDSVLRTAVEEIVRVVNASRVQIRLLPSDNGDGSPADDREIATDNGRTPLNGGADGGERSFPERGEPSGGPV